MDSDAAEVLEKSFNEPESLLLSEGAKRVYAMALYNILKHLRRRLREITPDDLKKYFSMRRKMISTSTLIREFAIIRKFFRYLRIELDFKLKLPRKEKFIIDPSSFLTNEEFEKLLTASRHPRDKALLMLLRETRIRIGEALALNVGDVEITERSGTIYSRC